jgi:hypothetical protein
VFLLLLLLCFDSVTPAAVPERATIHTAELARMTHNLPSMNPRALLQLLPLPLPGSHCRSRAGGGHAPIDERQRPDGGAA